LGYLGIPLCAGSLVLSYVAVGWPSLIVAWLVAPVGIWLALGLRADGEADENIDWVTDETPRKYDFLDTEDHIVSVWRISTATILLGVLDVVLSSWWAYYGPGWTLVRL